MGDDMTPESYSQAEVVRTLRRIEDAVTEVSGRMRSEMVPREVWEESWRALAEWKASVATDVVNLEAGLARSERDHKDAHSRIYDHVDKRVSAEATARVSGQRWAIGLATTAALGLVGTLLTILNMASGAA